MSLLLFSCLVESNSLDTMDCSTPGFPVFHHLPELAQTRPSSRWCHPTILSSVVLLFLTSIFPRIRVFSNESALCIRWPKYWSLSISLSNEYSGLIAFRIDSFGLLAVQGTPKSLLQCHSSKESFLWRSAPKQKANNSLKCISLLNHVESKKYCCKPLLQ